jgi:hypothetical protein
MPTRTRWVELKQHSSARAVAALAVAMAAKVGAASGVIAPLVTWLFVVTQRIGKEAVCLRLQGETSEPIKP